MTRCRAQPAGFGLGSDGDDLYLFGVLPGGGLSGYVHGFRFGGSDDWVSFGRYVSSDGREHFVAQVSSSLGTNNVGPRVGPVVISELMYHPPDVGGVDNPVDEFIELLNITGAEVRLYDEQAPTNAWRVRGGVDYDFPTNLTLGAGQYVLLVNFSPTNAAQSNGFCLKYEVPAGVRLMGPYGGKLNNGGDTVELRKPVLIHGTNVGWVLVDGVDYSGQPPWPCGTDGTGVSLQRQVAEAFGNDPANWAGAAPTAGAANTIVPPGAPVLAYPPTDQWAVVGGSASFTVGPCGTPPYTYRWLFNESPLPDATNVTYVIAPARHEDDGFYRVIVGNGSGSVTSTPVRLSVFDSLWPVITQQPQDQTVPGDGTASFTVTALGPPPLQYQWLCYGTNLPGQNGPTLILANVQPRQQGPYSVVVATPYGDLLSADAFLTVHVPCVILTQPTNVTFTPSPATNTVTTSNAIFSVFAAGMGPLSYQWTFWGTNLPGATEATLVISNAGLAQAGPYAVRVSDSMTPLTSSNATLRLLTKPTIIVPIQGQSVVSGGSVTFSVWAVPVHPTLPLTYRWLRGGTNYLTNTYSTFLASNVTNSTTYQVVVQNDGGTDYKPPVVLSVWADADKDGLPDRWMTNYFGHTNGLAADKSRAQDDADADGLTNLEEYQAGTNPTNALSVLRLVGVGRRGRGAGAVVFRRGLEQDLQRGVSGEGGRGRVGDGGQLRFVADQPRAMGDERPPAGADQRLLPPQTAPEQLRSRL